MDFIDMVMEKYGGSKMDRIFKSYLILSIIVKYLLFSLFFSPADPAAIENPKIDIRILHEFTADNWEDNITGFPLMKLVFDLLNNNAEGISEEQDPIQ